MLLKKICFFKQIYTHDQHMLTTDLLPVEEIRKRHRKNAFTFLGQFYGFVSECLLYFGMILSIKQIWHINIRMWLAMGLSIEFGILSVVEIMTSDCLVQYLPHKFVFPRNWFLILQFELSMLTFARSQYDCQNWLCIVLWCLIVCSHQYRLNWIP